MKHDSAIKKKATMLFAATWVGLKAIIPNAVTPNKDRFYMVSPTCGIRKNNTNEPIYYHLHVASEKITQMN